MAFIHTIVANEGNAEQNEEEQLTVVIRNTFIDVYTKPMRPRSQSVPASPARFDEESQDQAAGWSPLPPVKDFRPGSVDVSTEASGESEEDSDDPEESRSDAAGTSMASPMASPISSPKSSPTSSPTASQVGVGPRLVSTAPPFIASAVLPPPAPVPGGVCRSRLSSKAKAWTPASTAATAEHRVRAFQAEAQMLMEEVRVVVQMVGGCMGADVRWFGLPSRTSTCVLTVALPANRMCLAPKLTAAVKEAMLANTSRSTGVFLIGCKQTPFLAKQQGFTATLGEMRDETRACWSMYSTGFCKRAGACRWKHPQTSVSVDVNFVTW